jgi:hypothetical protein
VQFHPSWLGDGRQAGVRTPHAEPSILEAALDYYERGFSLVPQVAGDKKPCIPWKPYQDRRPTRYEIESWFSDEFPDAGIALILGPTSGLLVVDVDGQEAHAAYLERLGTLPEAPMVFSGSNKFCSYHQYFKYPDLPTNAKATPWNPNLEFRGYGGTIVAPPSLHPSGNRYRWAPGRSLDDLPLPEVPEPILKELRARNGPRASTIEVIARNERFARARLCRRTREFLSGQYAFEPGWNDRLYRAAADMAGCGFSLSEAMPRLLEGARPRGSADRAAARSTIKSAFARKRTPARVLAARHGTGGTAPHGEIQVEDTATGIRTEASRDYRHGELFIPVRTIHD